MSSSAKCEAKADKTPLMGVSIGSICSLDFMNDGFTVAAGTQNGKVLIYDLRALGSGGAPAKSFVAHERSHVSCVTFQHLPPKSAKGKPKVGGKENAKPTKTSASASDPQPPATATTGLFMYCVWVCVLLALNPKLSCTMCTILASREVYARFLTQLHKRGYNFLFTLGLKW